MALVGTLAELCQERTPRIRGASWTTSKLAFSGPGWATHCALPWTQRSCSTALPRWLLRCLHTWYPAGLPILLDAQEAPLVTAALPPPRWSGLGIPQCPPGRDSLEQSLVLNKRLV